jgi:hypothetical protein
MKTEKRGAWWTQALEDHPEATEATLEQVEDVFTSERTIAEDIWRGRGYVPYAASDWDAVRRAEPLYGQLDGRHQAYMQRLVAQRPGLVMQRNGFPGAPGVLAQLRPFKFRELGVDVFSEYGAKDEGVYSKSVTHSHRRIVEHAHADRRQARAANIDEILGREQALLAFSRDDVLDLAHLYELPPWVSTAGPEEWKFADSPIEDHIRREHGNVAPPIDDEHGHWPSYGKHVARAHDGKDVGGTHSHHEFAKYLLPPGEGTGARIDVHPLVWPLLERGGPVCYFALEGLLKSDAILTVGYTGPGTGTPVVNVPSVTLWAGEPGLDWLARKYLSRFDLVVIVPDSDGIGIPNGNYDVNSQARGLADRLRRCDVPEVVVAFPTAQCSRVCTHIDRDIGEKWKLPNEEHKQGADDMLGPKGKNTGGLAGMVIMQIDQATPAAIMRERSDIRSRERDLAVLEHVREIADPVTCVAAFSDRQIAPAVDRGKSQVAEAVKSLERRGYWERLDSEPVTGSRVMTRVRLRRDLVPEVQGYGRLGDAYALD